VALNALHGVLGHLLLLEVEIILIVVQVRKVLSCLIQKRYPRQYPLIIKHFHQFMWKQSVRQWIQPQFMTNHRQILINLPDFLLELVVDYHVHQDVVEWEELVEVGQVLLGAVEHLLLAIFDLFLYVLKNH